jgi:hypothetical protein
VPVVDKNIPLPMPKVFKGKNGWPSAYPFAEMAIGDSEFFPDQNTWKGPRIRCSKESWQTARQEI